MSHRTKFSSSSTILAMDCFFKTGFPPLASDLESKCILKSSPSIIFLLLIFLTLISMSFSWVRVESCSDSVFAL